MEDLDYTESTKILELEHDSWNQAQNIISRICWESEYYTYLMSLEYKKISLKKNGKGIIGFYVEENKAEQRLYQARKWAKQKTEDVLNVIFARIEAQIAPPRD